MKDKKIIDIANDIIDRYDNGEKIKEEEYIDIFVKIRDIAKEGKPKSLLDEIERLQNIIKEAREKIDNLGTYELLGTKYISKREVMKILDKENK